MFVSKTTIKRLESSIAAKSLAVSKQVNTKFTESGDSIYYAAVDLLNATNSSVTAVNNVYKYDAVLYYKQFSPHSDPNEYVKDVDLAQYQASKSVILLSAWDLKSLVDAESATQIAVVPCIQRNNYFECVSNGGASPDNLVNNDNFGQSLNLRTHTEDGIITAAWEILGFYEGVPEDKILDNVLTADTETGVITGSGVSNYRLLVRIDDADGRPRIGYMRIHPSDDPEYPDDDDEDKDCGVGGFPGTLPIDNDSGGFPGEEEGTDENSENRFPGESSGDDDFPGKIDKCW